MPRLPHLLLALLACALIAGALSGCSDDDPATPGGGSTETDAIAPLPIDTNPSGHSLGVPVGEPVMVLFSEPMDTASHTGNVTLPGATTMTWNAAGDELTIEHADWPEGEAIQLILGTGLKDVAGNALPQAFTYEFYTWSSTPVLMDVLLVGDPGAQPRNTAPIFLFSDAMDLTSVRDNTTVTQAPIAKTVPSFQVKAVDGDLHYMQVEFQDPLDALGTYTVTIGAAAQTSGGTALGAPVELTFTTTSEADETGPQILSVSPAVGSIASVDLDRVVVTFTEPVVTRELRPNRMSALLELFMASEPVWNAAGDELTLYVQHPLPAGVRLYAWFDDYSFYDVYGNGNTQPDSMSFTTAGTAQIFPLREDLRLYFRTYGLEYGFGRQTVQNVSGTQCERVFGLWNGTDFSEVEDHWMMSVTSTGLFLRGFVDQGENVVFDPPATLMPLPVTPSWSGSATVTTPDGAVQFEYMAAAVGPFSDRVSSKKIPSYDVILDDCYLVEIAYTLTLPGETDPLENGALALWYTPGLGIYQGEQSGTEYMGDAVVDEWEWSYYLEAAALGDHYEQPR